MLKKQFDKTKYSLYLTTYIFLLIFQVCVLTPAIAFANQLYVYLGILIFNFVYLGLFLIFTKLIKNFKSKTFFLLLIFWLVCELLLLYAVINFYFFSSPFIWYGDWYSQEKQTLDEQIKTAYNYLSVSIVIQSIKIALMTKSSLNYFRKVL